MLAILPAESRRKAEQSRVSHWTLRRLGYSKDQFDIPGRPRPAGWGLRYRDEAGTLSQRDVLPPAFFWGERWLLVTWCELREDYRCFRLDRCLEISATERHFSERADRSLGDFCAR